MIDISGTGLEIIVKASVTFPQGFNITQLAGDSDPFDIGDLQIVETEMGVNGDLQVWGVTNAIEITVAVIAGGDDDKNLAIIHEANRTAKGKVSSRDKITLTGIYADADSKRVTFRGGAMITGAPASSVASAGRVKTKSYTFRFENKAD